MKHYLKYFGIITLIWLMSQAIYEIIFKTIKPIHNMKTILLALLAACVIIITAQAIENHSKDNAIAAQQAHIDSLSTELDFYNDADTSLEDHSELK